MSEIIYPTFVTWKINLEGASGIKQLVSEKQASRIEKSLKIMGDSDYQFTIDPVNNAYLEKFLSLYEPAMQAKKHGVVHNIRKKVQQNTAKGREYRSVSLQKSEIFLGGMIYSIRKNSIAVAYRYFPHKLELKLPISCSYIAEYYVVKEALQLKKKYINHGKDRNLYGQGSAIGLAEYKLRLKAIPYASGDPENSFQVFDAATVKEDTLVLLAENPRQKITSAILFLAQANLENSQKYAGLLNQTNLKIDVRKTLS